MSLANSSLFSQLLSLVDRNDFGRLVKQTGSERASKGFASWDHFVSMLFCQLGQAKSLREIDAGLRSCEGKLRHLGMDGAPSRSTLSYANAHRPCELFESIFHEVLSKVRDKAPGKKFRFKSKLYSLDSTVIELCATAFDWATYRAGKGAAKIHLLLDHDGCLPCFATITEGRVADVTIAQQLKLPKGSLVVMDRGYTDYRLFERWSKEGIGFVTRLKKNADWFNDPDTDRELKEGSPIRRDCQGSFNCLQAGRKIKGTYRRVVIWLEDKGEEIELITNRMDLSAETIAEIYRQRWQIELFFKALKQNLKIKTFVGTSANAVRIQIWTALLSILLLKVLQFRSKLGWALSNLVALLRWNLFTHKNLWRWIDDPFSLADAAPPGADPQCFLDGIGAT
jgi:hypothetical protein